MFTRTDISVCMYVNFPLTVFILQQQSLASYNLTILHQNQWRCVRLLNCIKEKVVRSGFFISDAFDHFKIIKDKKYIFCCTTARLFSSWCYNRIVSLSRYCFGCWVIVWESVVYYYLTRTVYLICLKNNFVPFDNSNTTSKTLLKFSTVFDW